MQDTTACLGVPTNARVLIYILREENERMIFSQKCIH
jgi:hypothetical protein